MASVSKMKHKPLSERISLFESPSNSPSNSASASTSPKNSTSSNKPQITKTFSKANLVAIKSQFESGGSTSSTERTVIKTSETKSVVSTSSSHSQQSSTASSLTSTPVPTPTPPLQNSASGAKSGVDSANAQKERRKLPATPKSSSPSTNIATTDKNALKSTGSGGRSAVVASSKQASAGASPAKTPVSRTQPSANKSTHREHTPLHKKSSPNSGTSSASTFGNNVKQRSPTAPIPIAHALKKANNGSHQSDKANNNSSSREKSQQHGANIGSNKSNKSSPISAGANSINRVKAPVTKTLSSPLTPPKFATNNVTINVGDTRNNNVNDDDQEDDQSQRLHSTTIQTTTSTIRTNQGISITKQQQNIEVNKINNSYSISQVLEREQSESRKNSQEDVIINEKLMSSSESSSSTSPPSASPPPPPMLAPLIVPTVTVTLDPSNLNNKQHPLKKSPIISENDEVDTTVANNNFKNIVSMQTSGGMNSNSSVTGGRNQQYWTNQALQNDNSKTISEVIHKIISPQRMNLEVMIRDINKIDKANVELLKCLNDISILNVKTMISNAFHESYNLMGNKCILSNKDRLQLLIKYAHTHKN